MRDLWSKRCQGLTPYVAGEQPRGRRFIKLNTNENPYPPSPKAIEAIQREAGDALRLYPDPACTELRAAIGETLGVSPDQVFAGNGSDEVLSLAFGAFFDPDRPIRIPDITYSFYPVFADFYGLAYEDVPLKEDFTLPVEPFLRPSGGVVIANANAPTGEPVDIEDIRRIVEADPHRVVIVDEAYVDFGGRSALELVEGHSNVLLVRTLSKSAGLAGLRVGFAIGHPDLIAALNTMRDSFNSYPVDRLAQAGAAAAIRDVEYMRETAEKIVATRERTAEALKGLGFRVCNSRTNFLFVSCPGIPGRRLLDGLRERGILVRWWGKPRISGYLRITIGTDGEMEALCKAMEDLIRENT